MDVPTDIIPMQSPKSSDSQIRRELFIEWYKKTKNATESAKRAGFSVKAAGQIGCRLLKSAKVQNVLRPWLEEQKAQMPKETFVACAVREYQDKEENPSPVRIRALEIAGQALGHLGSNKIQVNVDQRAVNIEVGDINAMDPAAKWDKIRALLGS